MDIKRLFTSCFGLGFSPIAPGTFGSMLPAAIFGVMLTAGAGIGAAAAVLSISGIIFSFACLRFTAHITKLTGKSDPSEVVADEYAGQSITLLMAMLSLRSSEYPLSPALVLTITFVCFLLFRLFDIVKPWPVCTLERLPGGLGVLADDLFAGLYAGVCFLFMNRLGWIGQLSDMFFAGGGLAPGYAMILGAVQGLTEFLPVSSSGHLVLFESIIPGLDPDTPQMLLFDLSIHVATVGAILMIYLKDIRGFTGTLMDVKRHSFNPLTIYKHNPAWRFLICAGVTTVVTVIIYKIFEEPLKSARQLEVVAAMWLVTGTLLLITDGKKRTRVGLRDFGIMGAVVIGMAQSVAILPGISRSGATICVAILWGLHRKWAIQYSFLIAMPAILGGTLLELIDNPGIIGADILPASSIAAGMITAFAMGMAALKLLIFVSKKKKLKYFAIYCYAISIASFVYLILT